MNLGDIKRRVKRQFGDEAGAQITDADITDWANDAQIDITRKTECLQEHVETDSVAADASYDVPTDFLRLRLVEYNGKKLDRVELEERNQLNKYATNSSPTGEPQIYYVWGRKIWLYPAPESSGTGVLDIFYVKHPAEMSGDSDIPEIPTQYHEDIVRYCLARAKELDEEDEKAESTMQDYEYRVLLSKDEEQNPESDSYPAVRALPGDEGMYY